MIAAIAIATTTASTTGIVATVTTAATMTVAPIAAVTGMIAGWSIAPRRA